MRGALILAQRYGGGPISLAYMCDDGELKRDYLARVMGLLCRTGIVEPLRGKKGGYQLTRPPAEVTMLQIIEAIEGPQALNFCQSDPPICNHTETCKVHQVWNELQEIFIDRLSSKTLADCI